MLIAIIVVLVTRFLYLSGYTLLHISICCRSVLKLCLTLCDLMELQHTRLPFTIFPSLLKLMPIELMMPFNHLILCYPFTSCLQSCPASGSFPDPSANPSVISLSLFGPTDYRPPSFSFHGIFQARTLEWVAISYSKGSSQPRDWTPISCISPALAGRFFPPGKPMLTKSLKKQNRYMKLSRNNSLKLAFMNC